MEEINKNSSDYSYTRSVSFNLIKDFNNFDIPEIKEVKIEPIVETLKALNNELKKILFYPVEKENYLKMNNFKVKKDLIKIFFKEEYFKLDKKKQVGNKYKISDLKFLEVRLRSLILADKENEDSLAFIIGELEKYKNKGLRESDINFYLKKLLTKNNYLNLVPGLCENIEELNGLKNKFSLLEEKIKSKLLEDSQFNKLGFNISKGSLNYYTINKKPKEYFEGEIEENKQGAEERKFFFNQEKIILGKQGEKDFSFKNYYEAEILKELEWSSFEKRENKIFFDIATMKKILKELKSKAKSKWYEILREKKIEKVKTRRFFLFEEEDKIEEIWELTQQIEEKNKEFQSTKNYYFKKNLKENLQKLKKRRGNFLIKNKSKRNNEKYFKNWIKFIDFYKNIAQQAGRFQAKIKNLAIQKIESQKNKYWLFLIEKNLEKFLWALPKERRKEFKNFLKNKKNEKGAVVLNCINSLTKRALHKLCFAEESSFIEAMPGEIKRLQSESKKATNDEAKFKKEKRRNPDSKKKAWLELEVMKKVLDCEAAQELLDLESYDLIKVLKSKTMEEFEDNMVNDCYKIERFALKETEEKEVLEKFKIVSYKITSYDLENRNVRSGLKHYTNIWNSFWENLARGTYRINPEVNIFYKKKDEELKPYLEQKSNFDIKHIKHRNLKDSFKVSFSFSINQGKRFTDLSYLKNKDIQNEIDRFNKKFNNQNWNNFYKYGIDRGNIELATLCLAKFSQADKYEYGGKECLKPSFPNREVDLKCYELKKDYFTKEVETDFNKELKKCPVQNISYFIKNEKLFDKKTISFIDLTKAKVIGKKIVLNGDILTYLKLKKEGAKKLIWKHLTREAQLQEDKEYGTLCIKLDDKAIYFYEADYEGIKINGIEYNFKNILDYLRKYLEDLKKWNYTLTSEQRREEMKLASIWHIPTENKINNIRKAIVANMIGVINFLQKKYPGFVILEDLDKSTIDKHFQDLYINIGRVFENSLIAKFQSQGLVPAHIKNLIEIRENKKVKKASPIDQYGAIIFTDEASTSSKCPHCEEKWNFSDEIEGTRKEKKEYNQHKINDLKFNKKQYICGKHKDECGFDTKEIKEEFKRRLSDEINDPDKVAAYNISKKSEKLKEKLIF